MKKLLMRNQLTFLAGLLLVIPSAYFVTSAILNSWLGISSFWQMIEPMFDKPGNKKLGVNINLLILLGPVAALCLTLPQVIQLTMFKGKEELNVHFVVRMYSWNWLLIATSIFCLSSIFFYLIAENYVR